MPPSPFPQVWKVLGLDLCHSEDTVIRVKGTQRAKKKHHPLTPATQTLWLLPCAEGTGCSYFLPSPLPLPEELRKVHSLDKTPRLKWRCTPPVAPGYLSSFSLPRLVC